MLKWLSCRLVGYYFDQCRKDWGRWDGPRGSDQSGQAMTSVRAGVAPQSASLTSGKRREGTDEQDIDGSGDGDRGGKGGVGHC